MQTSLTQLSLEARPDTVLVRSVRVPGARELSGRAWPRLVRVSEALCLPAALILQTARTEGGGPCALDEPATVKPVRMFPIKCLLGVGRSGGGGGKEDRRRISLQELIYFQRLSVAPCKSDSKSL